MYSDKMKNTGLGDAVAKSLAIMLTDAGFAARYGFPANAWFKKYSGYVYVHCTWFFLKNS